MTLWGSVVPAAAPSCAAAAPLNKELVDYTALSRRELQDLAKAAGHRANDTTANIISALESRGAEALAKDGKPQTEDALWVVEIKQGGHEYDPETLTCNGGVTGD